MDLDGDGLFSVAGGTPVGTQVSFSQGFAADPGDVVGRTGYDPNGNRTKVQYPDTGGTGRTLISTFDRRNLLATMSDSEALSSFTDPLEDFSHVHEKTGSWGIATLNAYIFNGDTHRAKLGTGAGTMTWRFDQR